tara:strand:- start:278 stop:481 length:204 start_codon:yes stop_codon:yes gene_type:complete
MTQTRKKQKGGKKLKLLGLKGLKTGLYLSMNKNTIGGNIIQYSNIAKFLGTKEIEPLLLYFEIFESN